MFDALKFALSSTKARGLLRNRAALTANHPRNRNRFLRICNYQIRRIELIALAIQRRDRFAARALRT